MEPMRFAADIILQIRRAIDLLEDTDLVITDVCLNCGFNKVIVYGKYELLCPEDEAVFAYTRELDDDKLLVVCNFTENPVPFAVPAEFEHAAYVIGNYGEENLRKTVELKAYEAIVLRK